MEKVLSIIIPSYNMEKYLKQCLDSLLIPNIGKLDIMVINDGSKDSTLDIAKEYAIRYPDSIRVIDKPNGNYGSCINRGLKEAKGKYVKVLDADDSFYKDNFEKFIAFLSDKDIDLAITDYNIVDEVGNVTREVEFNNYLRSDCVFEFGDDMLSLPQNVFQMHAVTYRTDNLRKIGYCQTEGISYTDQEWMFLPMTTVRNVAYFNTPIYRYLVGRVGQTVQADKIKHYKPLSSIVKKMMIQIAQPDYLNRVTPTGEKYVENRLIGLISTIIKDSILYTRNRELHALAADIDDYAKENSMVVWTRVACDRIKPYIPIYYIKFWRSNGHNANCGMVALCRMLLNLYHS